MEGSTLRTGQPDYRCLWPIADALNDRSRPIPAIALRSPFAHQADTICSYLATKAAAWIPVTEGQNEEFLRYISLLSVDATGQQHLKLQPAQAHLLAAIAAAYDGVPAAGMVQK